MRQNLTTIAQKTIEYSFYLFFFIIPLSFTSNTSELFEFNKMWGTFVFAVIILSAWSLKIVMEKQIVIQRSPLDIPILLFLLAHLISTIFSMDPHVSLWGYYSRFNGGFYSILTYIFLYYAFISNFPILSRETNEQTKNKVPQQNKLLSAQAMVKRSLLVILASGVTVALWGFPSHFGYDPTCFLFRGSFDVSCWTESFQPKIRIFSTLGQPNWLAAYLASIFFIAIAFLLHLKISLKQILSKYNIYIFILLLVTLLFYADIIWTRSRSGFAGLIAGAVIFIVYYIWKIKPKLLVHGALLVSGSAFFAFFMLSQLGITTIATSLTMFSLILFIGIIIYSLLYKTSQNKKPYIISFGLVCSAVLLITVILGTPYTSSLFTGNAPKPTSQAQNITQIPQGPALESGGSESGTIRLIVWQGALDIFKNNPIFGSGVETYAYSYYQHRPQAHNLTTEWDYLYNKAHNEYLNYLATTGLFGFISYMLLIGVFLFVTGKTFYTYKTSEHIPAPNKAVLPTDTLSHDPQFKYVLALALVSGYITILISNFLGFSVVPINIFFFLFPAFVFILLDLLHPDKHVSFPKIAPKKTYDITAKDYTALTIIFAITLYLLYTLQQYWSADTAYAYGYNLDRAGAYQQATPYLQQAVQTRSNEPTFQDELSFNYGVMAVLAAQEQQTDMAQKYAQEALNLSNKVVSEHPNNVVFWKTRVRMLYSLSQLDPQYLRLALQAIQQAVKLAPTDAKAHYTLGVLYGQTGDLENGIKVLTETLTLRPNYRDAYFARGLFYRELAVDENGRVVNLENQKKAEDDMNYILQNIGKDDKQVLETLDSWK